MSNTNFICKKIIIPYDKTVFTDREDFMNSIYNFFLSDISDKEIILGIRECYMSNEVYFEWEGTKGCDNPADYDFPEGTKISVDVVYE